MKKLLYTLLLTMLALPANCFADELQDAIDDLSIDCNTTYFPKGEDCLKGKPYTAAIFYVDGDTLHTGYYWVYNDKENINVHYKSALRDLEDNFKFEAKTIDIKAKNTGDYADRYSKSKITVAIKAEYMKEFVKKMKNIIRLVKSKK